ncbi:LAETG motif-containing sortase-dependent surface protein [Streptomyces indicus]|uniref:LPXTG-motif cell wall anchor domain-containing protein n=1 Tax=Streptomyces indicus TaxID=417292 RepID=A0A1G9BME7_9ACTN|nr:LAETG motif-containing sortase-dependent surface protein [Streptomyces indicus]SDK40583.1 LPXTG-motif cell wall anchor domain-containing protein [Streptomyces indicus]
MSPARRSLLTATAAGSLLGALWFVPSATASGEQKEQAAADAAADRAQSTGTSAYAAPAPNTGGTRLAETGSTDTTPYIAGGLTFLISGVGIFALSRRRVVEA